ncbi:MAG: nitroreductase family deazaflavin-dependent oxidoreductase [bacterium]|nr:nitroreductase family deazaflavin-dependent oxidoreductase [bacterium]
MGWNDTIIDEFRASGGERAGNFAPGSLLLLHTVGARSGQPRVNPLVHLKDGERYLVVASYGGAPTHPAWYFNAKASPNLTIEVGGETIDVTAETLEPAERDDAYRRLAERYPFFADYALKTDRVIPVLALTPRKIEPSLGP